MAISRGEGYGVGHPVDGGIVAAEPWFSNDQVASGKFCDLKAKLFHMLVNGKFQVTCMHDLPYDRAGSIGKDQVFRIAFGNQRQVHVHGKVKIDQLGASCRVYHACRKNVFIDKAR